jgi:hypothetical protein
VLREFLKVVVEEVRDGVAIPQTCLAEVDRHCSDCNFWRDFTPADRSAFSGVQPRLCGRPEHRRSAPERRENRDGSAFLDVCCHGLSDNAQSSRERVRSGGDYVDAVDSAVIRMVEQPAYLRQ